MANMCLPNHIRNEAQLSISPPHVPKDARQSFIDKLYAHPKAGGINQSLDVVPRN